MDAVSVLKVEQPRPRGFFVFLQLLKVWKNKKISLRTKIRILETTVIIVLKYGYETWALRKTKEDFFDVSQKICLNIIFGYPSD